MNKGIYQGNGCCSINVIISVNQYLLFVFNSCRDTLDRFIHILHEERIMQGVYYRAKICFGFVKRMDTMLNQKV